MKRIAAALTLAGLLDLGCAHLSLAQEVATAAAELAPCIEKAQSLDGFAECARVAPEDVAGAWEDFNNSPKDELAVMELARDVLVARH